MSEPIKVGDLVVVVRWPCCGKGLGVVDRVTSIFPTPRPFKHSCAWCHAETVEGTTVETEGYYLPHSWVRRIPPLSELEGEKRDEEITA